MGDRANVIVKDGLDDTKAVVLYTHWAGSELPATLARALARGRTRWNDEPYLARVIFCEMVRGNEMGMTGYGISAMLGDGAFCLVVDASKGVVTKVAQGFDDTLAGILAKAKRNKGTPFEDFIATHKGE